MTDTLDMNNNKIKGLADLDLGAVGNVVNINHLNTNYYKKNDVENLLPKSYLYFGFEENGGLTQNSFEWTFGNGVNGAKIVIQRPGKIVSGTLWAVSGNNPSGEVRVMFEINGFRTLRSETVITKPDGEESVVVDYIDPIQVQGNDRIRVSSQTTNIGVSASTVCILIEVD